jgi:hypothetical protein
MLRLALFAAVALTAMVVPMTDPATPTPDTSECPYLRLDAADLSVHVSCVSRAVRTLTLCTLDATGATHDCAQYGPERRATFALRLTCTPPAPSRLEATVTDARGATVRRSSIPVDTGVAC